MAEPPLVVSRQDMPGIPGPEIDDILEEEAFLIKHSGETPEIALHSGLYYLFEDPEGPRLNREEVDVTLMKEAVFERYIKILLRDLKPENRDRRIYRGIKRSIANLERLKNFCLKEGFDMKEVKREAASHLLHFLETELSDVASGKRTSSINCTHEELADFAAELGIDSLPRGLKKLCMNH